MNMCNVKISFRIQAIATIVILIFSHRIAVDIFLYVHRSQVMSLNIRHIKWQNIERLIRDRMRNVPGIGVASAGFAPSTLLLGKFSSLSLLNPQRLHIALSVLLVSFHFTAQNSRMLTQIFFNIHPHRKLISSLSYTLAFNITLSQKKTPFCSVQSTPPLQNSC